MVLILAVRYSVSSFFVVTCTQHICLLALQGKLLNVVSAT